MLDQYIHNPQLQEETKHIMSNSMQVFLEHLEVKGYAPKTIHDYLGSVLHFSQWQRKNGRTLSEATSDDEINFLTTHIPCCHCPRSFPRSINTVRAALHRWVDVIGIQTITPSTEHEIEQLVLAFDEYLSNVIGLSVATRLYRRRHASDFLQFIGLHRLAALSQNDIVNYFNQRTRNLAPTSIATITDSINQLLQFIFNHNHFEISHTLRMPRPKVPYCGPLDIALTDDELRTLFNAFDRTYPLGKRDYAMARCLSDLGIRTGDVATLQLDDIDWQRNVITLRQGKSHRRLKLPMPETLVDALVDYLCHARPKTNECAVFVYHRAPQGDAIKPSTVRGAIRRAFTRAQFSATDSQVHRLRHTMATRLLQNGQAIKTIADILGHRCIDTTIRYTTVDRQTLDSVALPWPGRVG